jgi:predicted NUDIX family phosphoesterase
MKFVLVVDRRHLFPGLSPQGFLPLDAIDLGVVERRGFFAERDYMENCSHYKQIIPYIALVLGDQVLAYQRQARHSEQRLGGLWTIGFGGHVEPMDRDAAEVREAGLLYTAALRELHEETGLSVAPDALVARGCINSEAEDVSSVHAGLFFTVELSGLGMDAAAITETVTAQAEPHRVAWIPMTALRDAEGRIGPAPHDGQWEDWTRIAVRGLGADPRLG